MSQEQTHMLNRVGFRSRRYASWPVGPASTAGTETRPRFRAFGNVLSRPALRTALVQLAADGHAAGIGSWCGGSPGDCRPTPKAISPSVTLNLGVRYEYATPKWEDGNHLANYDLATQKPILAKDGGIYDRALVHPDRNNWAPRVGLAYQLTPKTVICSAFGVSYIHFNRLGGENLLAYNPPTVITTTINNPNPTTAQFSN